MKFIVIFEDAQHADPEIRKKHMSEHLTFLEKNAVEAAGPLLDKGGKGRDGLWVVEATNAAQVDRLVQKDPFWPTGLRASYAIIQWNQVFARGKRLIAP